MATTMPVENATRSNPLGQIRHDENVLEAAVEDVDPLAASIDLLGQLTPVTIRRDGDAYLLIAGHNRYAAMQKLGRSEIRAEVRDTDAERAAENIVCSQLNAS